jgi:hypothetical protein
VAGHRSLRAGDSDREHAVDRLRQAAADGRLDAEELEERVSAALVARTYGELDLLVADLPPALPAHPAPPPQAGLPARRRRRPGAAVAAAGTLTLGLLMTAFAVLAAGGSLRVHAGRAISHGRPEHFYLVSHHGFFPVIAGPVLGMLAIVVLCVAISWLFVSARSPAQPSH